VSIKERFRREGYILSKEPHILSKEAHIRDLDSPDVFIECPARKSLKGQIIS